MASSVVKIKNSFATSLRCTPSFLKKPVVAMSIDFMLMDLPLTWFKTKFEILRLILSLLLFILVRSELPGDDVHVNLGSIKSQTILDCGKTSKR